MVVNGDHYEKIQKALGIKASAWDMWVWKDYEDFRKNLITWKNERFVRMAESLSKEILNETPHKDDIGSINSRILSIKQKEAEFIRETLGKDGGYSKRNELSGPDGGAIEIKDGDRKQSNVVLDAFLDPKHSQ